MTFNEKRAKEAGCRDEWEVKSTVFHTAFTCLLNISVKCIIDSLVLDSGPRGEVRAGDRNLGIIAYICLESHGAREATYGERGSSVKFQAGYANISTSGR